MGNDYRPPGHMVVLEPIQDPDLDAVKLPETLRECHVQCGWVVAIGPLCDEQLEENDLIVFVGWKQKGIYQNQYEPWRSEHYALHEDDIELVIEEW